MNKSTSELIKILLRGQLGMNEDVDETVTACLFLERNMEENEMLIE